MPSLGFDLLDRHVVHGRAEEVACSDSTGTLSYAELLERVAALAGGLKVLGVTPGDEVAVSVDTGNLHVIVLCACVSLGSVPGDGGDVSFVESAAGVVMHAVEDEYDLDFVLRVGKTDPAPSLPFDPPGYAALVLEKWPMLNRFVA